MAIEDFTTYTEVDEGADITVAAAKIDFIESKQVMTFDQYIEMWEQNPGVWK